MAIIIDVPGIAAPGVDWPVLPSVPTSFPLTGLVSYLAVQGHEVNAYSRVGAMAQWVGSDILVGSSNNSTSAPAIQAEGGVDMMRTKISEQSRLIAPPNPTGGAWSVYGGSGFSVAFPVKMIDLATNAQGLLTVGGFILRYLSAGQLQVQRAVTFQTITPAFSFAAMAIVGVTYDDAEKRLRVYRNGSLVTESVHANWSGVLTAAPPVYGSTGNPSNPSECLLGDLARYNRELTGAEMMQVSTFLADRFGEA